MLIPEITASSSISDRPKPAEDGTGSSLGSVDSPGVDFSGEIRSDLSQSEDLDVVAHELIDEDLSKSRVEANGTIEDGHRQGRRWRVTTLPEMFAFPVLLVGFGLIKTFQWLLKRLPRHNAEPA